MTQHTFLWSWHKYNYVLSCKLLQPNVKIHFALWTLWWDNNDVLWTLLSCWRRIDTCTKRHNYNNSQWTCSHPCSTEWALIHSIHWCFQLLQPTFVKLYQFDLHLNSVVWQFCWLFKPTKISCLNTCTHMHAHTHACMHTHTHARTHTHTHTHTRNDHSMIHSYIAATQWILLLCASRKVGRSSFYIFLNQI